MKTDPAQPVTRYEPRNLVVRREILRFADHHSIHCDGAHHTHHSATLGEVWMWTFTAADIPLSELLPLLHALYPNRTVTFTANVNTDGLEVVVAVIPALPDYSRER